MTGSPADRPLRPFHLAVVVDDLDAARRFYGGVLGCPEGRRDARWIDFDLFGHQLVVHLGDGAPRSARRRSPVDGHAVPVPHFGVVLDLDQWAALESRLREGGVEFLLEPHVRFAGTPGEQRTLFVEDPGGNVLEFKGLADLDRLFDAGTAS